MRAAALGAVVAAMLASAAPPAAAAEAAPERQVVLVVVPELSYARARSDPTLAALARAGGLGLLTTAGGADLPERTALAIGAGRPVARLGGGRTSLGLEREGLRVTGAPAVEPSGSAEPGLLGASLAAAGLTVGYVQVPSERFGGVLPAMLAAMDRAGRIPLASLPYADAWLETEGLTPGEVIRRSALVVGSDPALVPLALEASPAREVLVVVVGAGASEAMRARGERVNAIVLARGEPHALLATGGAPEGLTSDTTRRAGVVAEVDLAPSVLAFLGVPAPASMVGSAVRIGGEPPAGLYARYLGLRRIAVPAGLAALAFGLLVLAVALVLVFGRARVSPRASRIALGAVVLAASLFVAMLPASWLPSFAPLPVGLTLAGASVGMAAVALTWGRGDPRRAVATVAVIGLALVAADAALGWPGQLTPMLGGGALDGVRFFGLGNAYAGVVLAGAVLGAARLPRRAAPWLLVGSAAFAGLPFLGADLGGCATLSAAAGLWIGFGRWRRDARAWLLGLAGLVVGIACVLAWDRVLPGGGTHVSRAADGLVAALLERLATNVRTTSAMPAAWLTLAGLGVWLALAWRTPMRLLGALETDPRWRRAIVVLCACGLLGWAVNDTYGLAGSAFTFACAAMLAPALAARSAATG
jgi:hypothetical protein